METRAAKKRRLIEEENKRNIGVGRDRLSDLPDEIAHRLLSFLPTKFVARTSVLSKRWRYLWACFPILNFSQVSDPWMTDSMATEDIISAVLSRRHENSNIKFFGFKGHLKVQWLHDWIPWLVKHKVEELVLRILSGTGMLDFPRPLSRCDSLRSFTLEGKSPFLLFSSSYVKATSGLRNLHTLSLTGVEFSDDDLFSDSSFPFLEKLTIDDCVGIIHLKICCLKVKDLQIYRIRRMNSLDISGMSLETLKINNCFKDMRVNESCVNVFAPNLRSFCWVGSNFAVKFLIQIFPILRTAQINYHFPFTRIKIQCAVNLFSAFSQVQNLSLYHQIFKILSNIYFELGGLPCSFKNLNTLYISTSLSKSDIPGIACLFKSSPVVHKLGIRIYCSRGPDGDKWDNYLLSGRYTEEQFWEAQAQTLNPLLCHLKVVKIQNLKDMKHEGVVNIARVQELVLHIWFSPYAFDFPSVLECDSLRSLTLTGSFRYEPRTPRNLYRWQHPFWFSYVKGTSGLRKLHTLSLTGVDFSDDLKDLQVFSVSKLNSVDISRMRLETLKFSQCFGECCVNIFGKCLIQSFPVLRKADIYYPLNVKGIKIHSTVNLFSAISQVQNRRLSFEIFEVSLPICLIY
ncbi:PREDICTED: putative [Prunus dulcis]|uniref:PREDICTED: putative n=1 Tax=Prunus dulcis TaxID=3755 RepID=A0A5E4G802_PRUDU|nr:PREDICTED: putative [Prunus dulcis]